MKRDKRKLYDQKCYDLADAFLEDSPHLNTESRREDLAALIQQTIEDHIALVSFREEPLVAASFEQESAMANGFKIEDGFPLPHSSKYESYPLRDLAVGQSFFLPAEKAQFVRMAASHFKKRNPGHDFTIRKFESGYRCWRIA